MPLPVLPLDRAIALACTLQALRARWVYVRCACGASHGLPIRRAVEENPAAGRWTLADLVVRVRCKACHRKVVTIHLTEDGIPPDCQGGDRPPATWALLLHGEPPGATSTACLTLPSTARPVPPLPPYPRRRAPPGGPATI